MQTVVVEDVLLVVLLQLAASRHWDFLSHFAAAKGLGLTNSIHVKCVHRPRVKGRFVKQMDVDAGLEMIKEHAQLLPPPAENDMEHTSDGECSADDDYPSQITMHCSDPMA